MTTSMEMKAMPVDKVAALAGKKGVTVYNYTHDAPMGTMDPATQIQAFRDICAAFDAGCRESATASNEALREQVLDGKPVHRTFQRLFPKVFADCTVRAVSPTVHKDLEKARKLYMVFLLELLQGTGTAEDKAARAMTIATRACMRETTEEDRAGPFTTRLEDLPDVPAGALPALTPLDVATFGGVVINQ